MWRVVYVVRRMMTKFSGRNGENANDYQSEPLETQVVQWVICKYLWS